MRMIDYTAAYKRARRKLIRSGDSRFTYTEEDIIYLLAEDIPLPYKYQDHALNGDWKGHRECHIKPDLLLIYRKVGNDILELVCIGSHADLFE